MVRRTIGFSDYWSFGPMVRRNIGMSPYQNSSKVTPQIKFNRKADRPFYSNGTAGCQR